MSVRFRRFALPRVNESVPKSRDLVGHTIRAWISMSEEAHDNLNLITSELVTNAVEHTTADTIVLTLQLNTRTRMVTVGVQDSSAALPSGRHAAPDDQSGRGLWLIAALANRHGAQLTSTGKWVWAEVALQPLAREQARRNVLRQIISVNKVRPLIRARILSAA
ncbi:ATP-binding protein [Kitasatospora sp. NPDC056273]|uniref:ATP-binding protein n=1 Tax=Kitasatospora sp. NPDC056273 TaxID=3345769 RepID=UPI0035E0476B